MSEMDSLEFTKMHGAGNDVVILDGIRGSLPEVDPIASFLLDRRRGIGGDQLLVARPARAEAGAAFRMEIWNPDGSRAEMCAPRWATCSWPPTLCSRTGRATWRASQRLWVRGFWQ